MWVVVMADESDDRLLDTDELGQGGPPLGVNRLRIKSAAEAGAPRSFGRAAFKIVFPSLDQGAGKRRGKSFDKDDRDSVKKPYVTSDLADIVKKRGPNEHPDLFSVPNSTTTGDIADPPRHADGVFLINRRHLAKESLFVGGQALLHPFLFFAVQPFDSGQGPGKLRHSAH